MPDGMIAVEYMEDASKNEILDALQTFATHVDAQFADIRGEIKDIRSEMKGITTKEDLKQFATKEDLRNFATKEDLQVVKNDIQTAKDELLTHIDGLVTLHQKNDLEIVALRAADMRLEERIAVLENGAN
jgi:hypothetical protein